jgi:hydrogenase maturation protease
MTKPFSSGLTKVTVRLFNYTPVPHSELDNREGVSMRTFASTHIILTAEGGELISSIDPPAELQSAVTACKNVGVWPVLVGDAERRERDMILASPIILYDYPIIAPESAGPLFDGTEIDEILTLRILTMTDEERREMRHVDEHARRLLERVESLSEDRLLRMHGTMRPPEPGAPIEFDDFFGASTPLKGASVGGIYLQAGDRVRLRPKARADVIDMALSGRTALIEAVEEDLEKRVHLAVVVEDDPGKDLGLLRQPGHRFFYGLDEVEPLTEGAR